jgi:hypothetical protein
MERMLSPTPLALATLAGVILCWLVFAGILLLRKRTPQAPEAKRDRMATLGIALQMCAYFLVWFQPPGRPFLSPVAALSGLPGILFSVFTVTIAGGPAWLSENAVRTLSKQWALRAATRDAWDADRDWPSDATLDRNAGGSLYFHSGHGDSGAQRRAVIARCSQQKNKRCDRYECCGSPVRRYASP